MKCNFINYSNKNKELLRNFASKVYNDSKFLVYSFFGSLPSTTYILSTKSITKTKKALDNRAMSVATHGHPKAPF